MDILMRTSQAKQRARPPFSTAALLAEEPPLPPVQQMGREIVGRAIKGMCGRPKQIFFFVETCLANPAIHLRPLYIREGTSEDDLRALRRYQYNALCAIRRALEQLGQHVPEETRETCADLLAQLSALIARDYADCQPTPPIAYLAARRIG